MQILRHVLAVAVAVILAATVSAADATKKAAKGKKGANARGTVVSFEKDADKNSGTLVVKVTTGKKPNVTTEEKKFKVTEATKVQTLVGKPKDNQVKDGSVSDIGKDKLVILMLKDDTVETIKVSDAKKKKNK